VGYHLYQNQKIRINCKACQREEKISIHVSKNDFVYWGKFIFSDESKFNLHGADRNRRVWCEKGSQLQPNNIQTTKKFGGGSIMV
jgi:hypothetical protein